LYTSWTGVSSRTGQVWVCLIASLYDWLMIVLMTDGPGGYTYVVWLVQPRVIVFHDHFRVSCMWLDGGLIWCACLYDIVRI
jgi:hypothetical protein